jgi:hypothetical protein
MNAFDRSQTEQRRFVERKILVALQIQNIQPNQAIKGEIVYLVNQIVREIQLF